VLTLRSMNQQVKWVETGYVSLYGSAGGTGEARARRGRTRKRWLRSMVANILYWFISVGEEFWDLFARGSAKLNWLPGVRMGLLRRASMFRMMSSLGKWVIPDHEWADLSRQVEAA
jgi:hypothetical protein